MPRDRYDGGAQRLFDLVAPIAAASGRNFLIYTEDDSTQRCKVDGKKMIHNGDYILAMREAHEQLSFKRKDLTAMFIMVFDAYHESWRIKTTHRAAWATAMTKRAANVHRVFMQGLKKKPHWLRVIMGLGEPEYASAGA